MHLFQYINNRLQGLVADVNSKGPTVARGAEIDALQAVFTVFRWIVAALFVPKVFLDFTLVNLRLKKVPAPALDLMRAEHQARQNAKLQKQGKKIGFQSGFKMPGAEDF